MRGIAGLVLGCGLPFLVGGPAGAETAVVKPGDRGESVRLQPKGVVGPEAHEGCCGDAVTPVGDFRVTRRAPGCTTGRLGSMLNWLVEAGDPVYVRGEPYKA